MQQPIVASQPTVVDEKNYGPTNQAAFVGQNQNITSPSPFSPAKGNVYHTPLWVMIVRASQMILGLIIMVLAGWLIHGVLLSPLAFALVCGLFAWIACSYALVSEKVSGARQLYNVYAILGLDALMAIFWLASMGAVAHLRSTFTVPVNVTGCYDDGSSVDALTCIVSRSVIEKRAVASQGGLAMMSGIAGLSALELVLFIATWVWLFMEWRKSRPTGPTPSNVEMNVGMQNGAAAAVAPQFQQQPAPVMQPQYNGQPMAQQQQQPAPVMQPQYTGQPMAQQQQQPFAPSPASGYSAATPVPPQYTGQQQQQQQQQPSPHYGQQPIPFPQVPTPGPLGTFNELPAQQQHQGQQMYSPSASPAPQGQYQPPAQPYNPQELPPAQAYNPQELPSQQQPQQYQQYPPPQ